MVHRFRLAALQSYHGASFRMNGPDRAVVTSGPEKDASIEFIRDANTTVRWVRVTGRIARKAEEGTKP